MTATSGQRPPHYRQDKTIGRPAHDDEHRLLLAVTRLCNRGGLLFFHDYDSRRNDPGFPDCWILGPKGLLVRELKSAAGRTTPAQTSWRYGLRAVRIDAGIWRPADLASGRVEREIAALGSWQRETAEETVRAIDDAG